MQNFFFLLYGFFLLGQYFYSQSPQYKLEDLGGCDIRLLTPFIG